MSVSIDIHVYRITLFMLTTVEVSMLVFIVLLRYHVTRVEPTDTSNAFLHFLSYENNNKQVEAKFYSLQNSANKLSSLYKLLDLMTQTVAWPIIKESISNKVTPNKKFQ